MRGAVVAFLPAAIRHLGQIGAPPAIEALTKALSTGDEDVRQAAAIALCRLLGPPQIEALCDELGHDISLEVATVFDYHLYAPDWLKTACGEVWGKDDDG